MVLTRLILLGSFLGVLSLSAADIRIVGEGRGEAVPVSIEDFRFERGDASAVFRDTLETNLSRWGWFRRSDAQHASYYLRGQSRETARAFVVDVEALSRRTGRTIYRERFREDASEARMLALRIIDGLTEAIHEVPGVASTRVAFIGSADGQQDLYTIGADGHDMMQLTRDGVPSFRPSWHPTRDVIFYTSFVRGFPDVYRVDLEAGRRSVVSREAGINAGASVSPDGRRLALILSRDGNPEVYIRDKSDGSLTRITYTPHNAEASPVWSPDGRQLAFVSDMQGGPHVFVVSSEGGRPRRISRGGSQNVTPDWGPDGRLVYSSRRRGRFQLVVYDPATEEETQITDGAVDHENPSWGRDGRHIVYARRDGRISTLHILDTQTNGQIRLTTRPGDWYFPAWSHR